MNFRVRLTLEAEAALERLFDFMLEGELALAEHAVNSIRAGVATLKSSPFTCRKANADAFLRELVISFGSSGYVALFETESATDVLVMAVRHQLEDDYH